MTVEERRRRWARGLTLVFLVALVLGPGPGATWIDGTREVPAFLCGVPALYAWLVLWFLVMASCIVLAARHVWSEED
ncbi:MAG: hypothetical protein H6834_16345 [Planctomycetes bacterium]|nr:hypothetical protein [Planctomycetota bacterium]